MKEKKVKKVGSFFNYIGKLFSSALLILLLLIGGFLVYYLVSAKMVSKNPTYEPKINLYTIVSGSMEPTIKVYDVIIDFRVKNPEDIKVGDVITFKSTSNISRGLIVTHRVIDVKVVNGRYEYVTKGDYNPTSDTDTAKFDNIIGNVTTYHDNGEVAINNQPGLKLGQGYFEAGANNVEHEYRVDIYFMEDNKNQDYDTNKSFSAYVTISVGNQATEISTNFAAANSGTEFTPAP